MALNHVALTVRDRERSATFYGEHFGLVDRVHEDSHLLILSGPDGGLLALSEGEPAAAGLPRTNHFGFQLARAEEVHAARERLRAAGVAETDCRRRASCGCRWRTRTGIGSSCSRTEVVRGFGARASARLCNGMDTVLSARQAARALRTSAPRVTRCIQALGLDVERAAGGKFLLTERDLSSIRRQLGAAPKVPGLSRTEARVLAALSRAPVGLASVRAVARRSGVSPTAAAGALERLVAQGLALAERRLVPAGRAREARILRANLVAPEWPGLAPALARVELPPPAAPPAQATDRVPGRLRHLFWNVASRQLDAGEHGPFVARRLLQAGDLEGLAWGAAHLAAADWEHAARARALDPQRRALAANLVAAAT